MAIELNLPSGGTAYNPKVSFPEPGTEVVFGIVSVDVEDQTDFRTGEVLISEYNGKPKTQVVVTIVVKNEGALTSAGKDDAGTLQYKPLEVGEVAELVYRGHNRYDPDHKDHKTWGWATDQIGKVNVGDIGRAYFERTAAGAGSVPKKIIQTELRPAKPEEAAFVKQCEDAYYAKQATPKIEVASSSAAPSYASSGPDLDAF